MELNDTEEVLNSPPTSDGDCEHNDEAPRRVTSGTVSTTPRFINVLQVQVVPLKPFVDHGKLRIRTCLYPCLFLF